MKLIMESWRNYLAEAAELLTEISYHEAKKTIKSKALIKRIKAYNYDRGIDPMHMVDEYSVMFEDIILSLISSDLTDNQQGEAIMWLTRPLKDPNTNILKWIENILRAGSDLKAEIEFYLAQKNFMPEKDMMSIKIDDLHDIVEQGTKKYHAHLEQKRYQDVDEGTDVLMDNEDWFIAVINNKGAACHWGKDARWCTAAPGTDMFARYWREDDPLFYFEPKGGATQAALEAPGPYQFHYGSPDFADKNNQQVNVKDRVLLHNLLMKTGAAEKYPKVKEYDKKAKFLTLTEFAKDPENDREEVAKQIQQYFIDHQVSESSHPGSSQSEKQELIGKLIGDLRHPNRRAGEPYAAYLAADSMESIDAGLTIPLLAMIDPPGEGAYKPGHPAAIPRSGNVLSGLIRNAYSLTLKTLRHIWDNFPGTEWANSVLTAVTGTDGAVSRPGGYTGRGKDYWKQNEEELLDFLVEIALGSGVDPADQDYKAAKVRSSLYRRVRAAPHTIRKIKARIAGMPDHRVKRVWSDEEFVKPPWEEGSKMPESRPRIAQMIIQDQGAREAHEYEMEETKRRTAQEREWENADRLRQGYPTDAMGTPWSDVPPELLPTVDRYGSPVVPHASLSRKQTDDTDDE